MIWILTKISSQEEWRSTGTGRAGGVAIPGGNQELWRCSTEEHGGDSLDMMNLMNFSNLDDSVT